MASQTANPPASRRSESHGRARRWHGWLLPGVVAAVLITLGAVLGQAGADHLARQQALDELHAGAGRVSERLDEVLDEAVGVFDRLARQNLEQCSDAELLAMRTELFNARFIRDIGRIDDLALKCSTALGVLDEPHQSSAPDIALPRNIGLRTDREIIASQRKRTMVIEQVDYNAVVDPAVITDLSMPAGNTQLFLRTASTSGSRSGWHPFERGFELGGARALAGDACSTRSGLCVRLQQEAPVLPANHNQTRIAMGGLGGAVGLALFLAVSPVLRRERTPEQRLRQVLAQGRIHAAYQPILRLPDGHLAGVEALARWHDDSEHPIPVEEFIDLAERLGLIGEVSTLMIRAVAGDLAPWLAGHPDQFVAINIAPAELADDRLLEEIREHLLAAGVAPHQVVLEITERTMIDDQATAERIEALARHGFRVYADDFGVGYCGLAYLNDMDVHGIKISHLFTAAVATDSPKAALVPRITELARELGLDVIIEGVETRAQAAAIGALEPILVQGWLYSEALGARQLRARYS